jgi:hypothetical protein
MADMVSRVISGLVLLLGILMVSTAVSVSAMPEEFMHPPDFPSDHGYTHPAVPAYVQLTAPATDNTDIYGSTYAADSSNNRIQKFDSSGRLILTWGSSGSGAGQFNNPSSVAVYRGGYVFVADTNNYRIQKFDLDGQFITSWGSRGYGDGQFTSPIGVAVDATGYVYVTDSSGRVQKFTSSGSFVASSESLQNQPPAPAPVWNTPREPHQPFPDDQHSMIPNSPPLNRR